MGSAVASGIQTRHIDPFPLRYSVSPRWQFDQSNSLLSTEPCWLLRRNSCLSWCLQIERRCRVQTRPGPGAGTRPVIAAAGAHAPEILGKWTLVSVCFGHGIKNSFQAFEKCV